MRCGRPRRTRGRIWSPPALQRMPLSALVTISLPAIKSQRTRVRLVRREKTFSTPRPKVTHMTSLPQLTAVNDADSIKDIIASLDPSSVEIDSLGRIILKSAALRNALLTSSARARALLSSADSPTNGHQCGCFNHTGCHRVE